MKLLALDPGRNLGVAWVDERGRLLRHDIITLDALRGLEIAAETLVLVGDGTGSDKVRSVLRERRLDFELIDERDSSLEGRDLYFEAYPPHGLRRFLPRGLWSPPRPIDDFAAYALALRYLKSQAGKK